MKLIPNAVSRKVARQVILTQKHSPTILFAAGVVGVVATAVLASRATLHLEEVLDDTSSKLKDVRNLKHSSYTEDDRQKDKIVVFTQTTVAMAKLYGPTVLVGTLSIAALTRSHVVLTRRNAALTAAYAALDRGFKEYRRRVIGEIGEEREREIRYDAETREFITETKTGPQVFQEKRVGPNGASIYARFFDECSKNWDRNPEYNLVFLRAQQQYANDMLRARGHVFLNEVYDQLGIDRTKAGAVVGWVIDSEGTDNFIDFGMYDADNERARAFVNGREGAILLDFNVDGVIYDKI